MDMYKRHEESVKISYRGYSYIKGFTSRATQNWRCVVSNCHGKASTHVDYHQSNIVPIEKQSHNHPPNLARVEVLVAIDRMLEESITSRDTPLRIASEAYLKLTEEAQNIAPTRKTLAEKIRQRRKRHESEFPTSLAKWQVPEKYKIVEHSSHVIHDKFELNRILKTRSDRAIIFASDTMLDELQNSAVWMIDQSTVHISSLTFELCTIQAIKDSRIIPTVYAMLPDKKTDLYKIIFRILISSPTSRCNVNPKKCVIPFNTELWVALRSEFPEVIVQGCFNDFTRTIIKQVVNLELADAYLESEEIRIIIKSLCALAFLPKDHIAEGFQILKRSAEKVSPDLSEIFAYFEDTFLERLNRGENPPKYFSGMWNMRQKTPVNPTGELQWFQRAVPSPLEGAHSSMFSFLDSLQKQECVHESMILIL